MKNFFTIIDIYGTKFHFYFHRNIKFKTWNGGIITIIFTLISICFIYIVGEDFIYRKNPYYTSSLIGEDYKEINLTNEKIVIAFRFEDDFGFNMNISKYIYPMIYYYSAIPNSNGEYLKDNKEEYITYRKCKESDFEGNENLLSIYGELYCIDWSNKTFGGFWDNDFIYYFAIRLFYCENGQNYSMNNAKCTSFEDLNDFFSNNLVLFSIYYTSINFRVNNINQPFHRKYKSYYTYLDYKFRKIDNIYLQEQILNDNKGWLTNNNNNISIWGGESISSDYNYYSSDIINTEGFSSMIYSLNIYMSSNKIYYTRKYMKIQEVFSMIGGLLTCFHFIGKIINKYINFSMKKSRIVEKFFKFTNKDNKNFNSNFLNNNINQDITLCTFQHNKNISIRRNFSFEDSKTIIDNTKHKKSFNFLSNNHSNKFLSLNSKNNVNNLNENSILRKTLINKKNSNKQINLTQIIVNSITKEDIKKKMKSLFCWVKKRKNKDLYDLTNDIYIEKCGLFNYFQCLKEINFLKEMFLNPEQVLAIDFTNKININFQDSFLKSQNNIEKIEKVIEYFKNIFKYKTNSELDNYIFNQLDENITNKIINNLN